MMLALATGVSLRLLAEPARTVDQAEAVQPVPTALNAAVQAGEIVGREQRRRVFMNVGGRRLILLVPQGFRVDNANPEKVVFVNRDYTCVLSFRIAVSGVTSAASINMDVCRELLLARLGELKILEEFYLTAANQSGPAFELDYRADGVARSSQVAFIPSPVGVLEFSLASSPEGFQLAKSVFRGLLRGLSISDASGKLEFPPAQTGS